jgi:hypothetical protein
MDEYNKNYTLYLVGGFFVFLVIVFVAVGLIVILLPAKNVQQFGPCTEQSECAPGLVCSMVSPTGKCLGGLGFACTHNSDCAAQYMCTNSVCSSLPTIGTDLILNTTVDIPVVTPTINTPINLPINLPPVLPNLPNLCNLSNYNFGAGLGAGGNGGGGGRGYRNFSPLNIGKKKLF